MLSQGDVQQDMGSTLDSELQSEIIWCVLRLNVCVSQNSHCVGLRPEPTTACGGRDGEGD